MTARAWVDEVAVTPLRDAGGELRHCVIVHDDVTELVAPAPRRATAGRRAADRRRVQITGGLARFVLDSLEEGVVLFGARRRDRRLQRLARCASSA